jgi:E3 ubiquitin-protein ligase RGLG
LHDLDEINQMNPYEQVIDIIGRTLRDFDDDNRIPCFGFGDELTGDHSIFTFSQNGHAEHGFSFCSIRQRYREIVPNVTMAGPTSFAPIINQAVDIVNKTGGFHILVIIADGQVTRSVDIPPNAVSKNEKETIDAILYASQFPLGIIMVGVGDGPWDAMIYFDNYLVNRKFDNFQFVEFHVSCLKYLNTP